MALRFTYSYARENQSYYKHVVVDTITFILLIYTSTSGTWYLDTGSVRQSHQRAGKYFRCYDSVCVTLYSSGACLRR